MQVRHLIPGRRRYLRHTLNAIDEIIRRQAGIAEMLRAVDAARTPVRLCLEHRVGRPAAKALTLKLLNLLLAKYHFARRGTTLVSRPFGLTVDPSNGCNLACPGCVHSTGSKSLSLFNWDKGLLGEDRFARFLARYGACAMQVLFCNYGEPTTNPKTPRLIEMAKGYLTNTLLSTNLSVARFDAEAYVRSGLDFMHLAIDGATQPTYSKFRKNGDISVAFRNAENLVEAKRRLRSRTPVLRWQYLAFEHNAHEMDKAAEIAQSIGLDQFSVVTPFDVSWDDPEVHPATGVNPFLLNLQEDTEHVWEQDWGRWISPEAADTMDRELDRGWSNQANTANESETISSNRTCSWLYRNMTLDANGRVLPCDGAPAPDIDLVFGSFGVDESDVFNSEHYLQARRYFGDPERYEAVRASNGPAPYCAKCDWNQDQSSVSPEQLANYLSTASHGGIDGPMLEMFCSW